MKQTKTTLIFGVLLAIIVIVLVTLEFKNKSQGNEADRIENAAVLPVVQKTLIVLKETLRFR